MEELNSIINNRKIDFEELLKYGFTEKDNCYEYHTKIKNNEFEVIVSFSYDRIMTTKVIDLSTNEEYYLINLPTATGEYIGEIRKEYEMVIKDIFEKCSEIEIFKSNYTKQVIKYVKEKYQEVPEFLWGENEATAAFRHKEDNKWYGVLLKVSKRKLGLDSDEIVEIIDVKIDTKELEQLVDYKIYFPGYHMNKKHWLTIMLDGSVPIEEIYGFIDKSYAKKHK